MSNLFVRESALLRSNATREGTMQQRCAHDLQMTNLQHTKVQAMPNTHLRAHPEEQPNNAASRSVAAIKLRTCCLYLFIPCNPPSPSHISISQSPSFGTLTAPDGQVGRRRQVPVANSPSPVVLLPFCGEKGDGYHDSRCPKPLWNNSSSSAAPHLSLPSTVPARRRSITVYWARPKRPVNYKTSFFFTP